jgi:RNA-binding protein 26
MNTITKLSGYFERFGTIVNLQVRYEGDPESAIVQFSSPFEAKAAHDCTEAVLNNRFIRVYYLKVNTGGGIATDNKPPLDHSQVSKSHHSAGVTGQATNTSSSTHFTHSVNYTQTTARTSQATPTTKSPVAPPIHHPPPRQHHKSPMAVPTVTPTATNLKRLELHKKTQSLYESQLKQQKVNHYNQ